MLSLASSLVELTPLRDLAATHAAITRAARWSGAREIHFHLTTDDIGQAAPDELTARTLVSGQIEKDSENQAYFSVAVPLCDEAKKIGVLRFDFAGETRTPNDGDLTVFALQAATALGNARLFEQLQRAKQEWERTFDGMVDGVSMENGDGLIVRVNGALAALLGVPMAEILGRNRNALLRGLENFREVRALSPVPHIVPEVPVQNGEFCFGSPTKIVSQTMFAVNDDRNEKPNSVCVLRDVTEPRRLQEQLLQTEKLAALGELVSGVAHELNNPLTAVLGYAQLLESDPDLPPAMTRPIQTIGNEAARASRIVGNLLAFARREEPRKIQLDINEVVRAVVEIRAYQLQAHNVRIVARYSPDLPPVLGDSQQLQQVLLNILNNASQAVQSWRSGGEIVVSTELCPEQPGVRISVMDDGPGIAPEHLRRIFDPFWTTKPLGEGTGLGMSISLGLVSNHGGKLGVESTLGHGAHFFVDLPVFVNSPVTPESIESSSGEHGESAADIFQPPEPTAPSAQILVIDDEEPIVMLIEEILALDGHVVTAAFNGAEALAVLADRSFDLILSDVRMPAVGGPTFFETLQTTRPDLLPRVVFVTGDTVSPSTREFLRRAARPVLSKPFDPERLRALVNANLLVARKESET